MQHLSTRGERQARWMVPALCGFVAGSAVQLFQPVLFSWWVYATMLGAGLAGCGAVAWRPGMAVWRWSLLLLACAVAAFGLTGWRAVVFASHTLAPALEGRDLQVTGVVAAMPQVNETGTRFRLQVEAARLASGAASGAVQLPPAISLGWYNSASISEESPGFASEPSLLRAGERWQMTVRLKAPHGNSNPHGFDYELWLWEQGLQATGYVRTGSRDAAPQSLGQTWAHPVEWARQQLRDRILERVADRKSAALIAALVVGDQNVIDRVDWDVFRATGVAHLMSISGLHVTMFAWLAAALVGALWRRSTRLCLALPAPHAALAGGLLLAVAYAVFSGWGVPAQRTIWMLATVSLLRLSGKQWPWPVVWLLACATVVAVDPWALMQAGFWLSFVAVGVLFASGSGAAESQRSGLRGKLGAMVHEQWVVTVALTPLTLLLFGQVSVVGLVANALAIPWVTLLVTPLAMAGALWPPLWVAAHGAITALAWYLQWLAQLPFAAVSVAQAPLWAGAAGVAGGLLLVLRLPWPLRFAGVPLLLPVLLWQAPRPPVGQFDLLAADIGQGNAVLVRTANHALLYDAGPRFSRESDAGHRVLVPLLRALDVRLDTLVLSHRDTDHVGGAMAVLAMQPQAALLSSIEPEHELQAVRPAVRCRAGQRWTWDGVDFSVLHPQDADYAPQARPNALSCVLRIAARADGSGEAVHVALLAGDIERAQESRLVASGAPLRADVLLVPHHGSKTSSSPEFLDAVAPRFALVQAGYRNRFGHPAGEPLERYAQRRIAVMDSPYCGAMGWRSSQPEALMCQRVQGLRYWQHVLPRASRADAP